MVRRQFSKEVCEHGSIGNEGGGTGISGCRMFHEEGNIKYKGPEAERYMVRLRSNKVASLARLRTELGRREF